MTKKEIALAHYRCPNCNTELAYQVSEYGYNDFFYCPKCPKGSNNRIKALTIKAAVLKLQSMCREKNNCPIFQNPHDCNHKDDQNT